MDEKKSLKKAFDWHIAIRTLILVRQSLKITNLLKLRRICSALPHSAAEEYPNHEGQPIPKTDV